MNSGSEDLASGSAAAIPIWTTSTARVLAAAIGLANLVIVARVLGPERRGALAVAEALVGLIVALAGSWLGALTSVRAARDGAKVPHLLAFNCWWSLAVGAALAAVGFVAHPYANSLGLSALDPRAFWAALASVPAHLFNTTALGLSLGAGRVRAFTTVALVQANAYLPALGVVALGAQIEVWTLLVAAATIQYALSIGILAFYRRASRTWGDATAVGLTEQFRFGTKLAAASIASYVVARSGVFLLDAFGDDRSIGVYAVAARIGDMLLFVPNTVCLIILARLGASRDARLRYAETLRFQRILTLLVAGAALAIAATGAWLVPLLFGAAFASSYPVMLILLPGIICLTAERVLAQHLAAAGVPRAVVGTWMAAALLSVALGFVLVPRFGPIGVALTASIVYAAVLLAISRVHARLRA